METVVNILHTLAGRPVTVVGGGVSGVAAAALLVKHGARVLVSDKAAQTKPELEALGVALELGAHSARIAQADLVVTSPGVSPEVLRLAGDVPVIGELELGYALMQRATVCAVTGTNGKTTTTALIGHIVQAAGRRVFVGGNIGAPLSGLALREETVDNVVLEVSSYQAEGLRTLAADVAVYLNLTPDHLDRYPDIEAYAAAKQRLFDLQGDKGTAILSADDARVRDVSTRAERKFFSTLSRSADAFLSGADTAEVEGETFALGRGLLRGRHNRENQLAAILATRALGIASLDVQKGLDTFAGVEHRIELCGTVAGVQYFNDSKATNDDAAQKALVSFAQPLVWLAGGKDKHGGYAASAAAAKHRVKLALLFGEAAPLIADALRGVCDVERVSDLAAAVSRAAAVAREGDVVLLSPACSSFDQFKSYEERGRLFKTLVKELEHA